ncbi:MAG: hypothetical protein CVU81_00995 [Euryarchaeota archaeon HGW-Euryarchaeota-1]|nr:MAG: hypothetical protein CVU81_00995 [Euryarchaeota archaeon HGW-Euryarchaeota-1]
MTLKISLIIPTRNRIDCTIKCVESVLNQTIIPDEIIIVDASDTEILNLEIKNHFNPIKTKIKYLHTKQGLTFQRNIGIKNSSGDIIFFFDDDVILENDFIKEILKIFENDPDKKIGGVMGNITNITRHKQSRIDSYLHNIFFLSNYGGGKFKPSGFATWVHGCDKIKNTEFLSGCDMAFRRKVLNEFKFDENLKNYCYMEDVDFSYRVSRKYQNIYTPYAKVKHMSSFGGMNNYDIMRMRVINHYYLFKKNFPQTLKHRFAFYMSICGLFLMNIKYLNIHRLRGILSGLFFILKSRNSHPPIRN